MSIAAELNGVAKRYGDIEAVRDISLAARGGECLALVGHNGAGKTTLMKLMLGLIFPDHGQVRLLGEEPGTRAGAHARRAVGFLPESVSFHGAMTGRETLRFYARLKGASDAECVALLERVQLIAAADKRVRTYSKGMRQRLGLAQALLGTPRLLLLDEPGTGLDPILRHALYELIRDLRDAGTTIVLSSHALAELEARTDRVAVLSEGRLVACGTVAELSTAAGIPVRIRIMGANGTVDEVLHRFGDTFHIRRLDAHAVELQCAEGAKMAVLRDVAAMGGAVADVEIRSPTLDEVYARLTVGEGPA